MLKYPSVQNSSERRIRHSSLAITERHWFGKNGILAEFFKTRKYHDKHYILKWKDFLCIALCWELTLFNIQYIINLILQWGCLLVIIGFIMFTIALSVPQLMLLLFLGQYSRRGYVFLWEWMPIFKGIIWSSIVFNILGEIINVAISGLALRYFWTVVYFEVPWKNCNFTNASDKCYLMSPIESYQMNCTSDKDAILHFPAYEYFLNYIIQVPESYDEMTVFGTLQTPWVVSVSLTWFVIFLLIGLDFHRFAVLTSVLKLLFVLVFIIPTVVIIILFGSTLSAPSNAVSQLKDILNFQFWLSIMRLSYSSKRPDNFVVLGSMLSSSMMPTTAAISIYGYKSFILIIITVWFSISIQLLQRHYKVLDINCVPISGLLFIFAVIPDVLTRFPLKQFWLIFWFFGIWFIGTSTAGCTLSALLNSLSDKIPGLTHLRWWFSGIICIICFLLNVIILTSYFIPIQFTWMEIFLTDATVILQLVFSCSVFLYSLNVIASDFHFMFRTPLNCYWIHTLKFSGLFIFSMFISICTFFNTTKTNLFIEAVFYAILFVTVMPMLSVTIYLYMKQQGKGTIKKVVTPTSLWGPPTMAKKENRSNFHPERNIHLEKKNVNITVCLIRLN